MTGQRFSFTSYLQPAERWDREALASNIGKPMTVNGRHESVPAVLIDAVLADDGRSVEFTVELPDGFDLLTLLSDPM